MTFLVARQTPGTTVLVAEGSREGTLAFPLKEGLHRTSPQYGTRTQAEAPPTAASTEITISLQQDLSSLEGKS